MKIKLLGTHNTESRTTRLMSLLVDGVLALDAGGLTSSLSFRDQQKIKALLITHAHYDHIRDIPALAMNRFLRKTSVDIYTHQPVADSLTRYFLNDELYPEFHKRPAANPTLKIHILEPLQETTLEGYRVLPLPVNHSIPAMGYQITSTDNKTIFYTGDTGIGISEVWRYVSPQVLFIELTASNTWEEPMKRSGHLTPGLLQQVLASFRDIKGYLPRVIAVHINSAAEKEIAAETARVEQSLGTRIELGREGMQIEI
jgi:ribonuclease BN (tRNA processing enzyme)